MASTSHNPTPPSFASPSPTTWDVFLSFRGKDTGNSFTDYLYDTLHRAGVQTFRDKFELRSGEVISDALVQAIQESKIYVVVLSENYASSRWCLDELVEILRCCESMDRLVVPVFYDIEPSVVRYQTGKFSEAFQKHANRSDGNYKLDKWRHTLEVVANFSGYQVDKNKSQVDVIHEIVAKVLDELNPSTFDDPKYQVGLDSRVKDIEIFSSTLLVFLSETMKKSYNIDILKKRCLLTINFKGLMMHDLLIDMGRKIACNSSPNAFEKHTRVWVSENIQKLLKENQGTQVIKGINNFDICLEDKQESIIPSNLHDSLAGTYTFGNIKDLIFGFHRQKHTLNKLNTGPEHLISLNMSYCNLATTTYLTGLTSLKNLSFTSCEGLKEVHESIGSLVRLVSLNFRHCENLKSLPDSICNLRALKSLNIGGCSNLEAIPMNLGDIESLEELNAEWLTINKLPHSIGHLSKLIKLNLSFCRNLQTLPDSFCNLRSLEILNISWCSRLKELPKELRNLESLVELRAETLPTVSKLLLFKQFT